MTKTTVKNSNKVTVVSNTKKAIPSIAPTEIIAEIKPKKVNILVAERKIIKSDIMDERYKLSFNLLAIKSRAAKYVELLQSEYNVIIDANELFELRAPSFIPYLTESQVKAQEKNGNRWTVSMVLILIAKYVKNK